MDTKHFSYFITIVESHFNLSAAAKKIHISQSALSKIITSFEQDEGILLFNRHNGRLVSLTSAGRKFYLASQKIVNIFDELMEKIMEEAEKVKGKLIVGIPPLVLTVVFSKLLSGFATCFPNVELEIFEAGSEVLRESFLENTVDFAVLLTPTNLNDTNSNEYTLYSDELAAFLSKKNKLSNKMFFDWRDIENKPIAIFNETFTINRLLTEKFIEENIQPNILIKSASWDFLVESIHCDDTITILPKPISNFIYSKKNFVQIPFKDPIPWEVVLVEHAGRKLTIPQKFFKQYLLENRVYIESLGGS